MFYILIYHQNQKFYDKIIARKIAFLKILLHTLCPSLTFSSSAPGV